MADKLFDIVFVVETAFMQQFCDAFVFWPGGDNGSSNLPAPISVARYPDGSPAARRYWYTLCRQYAFIFRRIFTSRRWAMRPPV